MNWYIDTGYPIFSIQETFFPLNLIYGLINAMAQGVATIFNLDNSETLEVKSVTLSFTDAILDVLKIKASDKFNKAAIEIIKFFVNFDSLGLSIYDVCGKLLDKDQPHKILFSFLWMFKIISMFSGSVRVRGLVPVCM